MAQQPIDQVRKLITNYKEQRVQVSAAQICRHVASELGIPETEAAELIQEAAANDLAQKHRFR
jgi:hypothetical protein